MKSCRRPLPLRPTASLGRRLGQNESFPVSRRPDRPHQPTPRGIDMIWRGEWSHFPPLSQHSLTNDRTMVPLGRAGGPDHSNLEPPNVFAGCGASEEPGGGSWTRHERAGDEIWGKRTTAVLVSCTSERLSPPEKTAMAAGGDQEPMWNLNEICTVRSRVCIGRIPPILVLHDQPLELRNISSSHIEVVNLCAMPNFQNSQGAPFIQ